MQTTAQPDVQPGLLEEALRRLFAQRLEDRPVAVEEALGADPTRLDAGRERAREILAAAPGLDLNEAQRRSLGPRREGLGEIAALLGPGLSQCPAIVQEAGVTEDLLTRLCQLDGAAGRAAQAGRLVALGGDNGALLSGATLLCLCDRAVLRAEALAADGAVPAPEREDLAAAFADGARRRAGRRRAGEAAPGGGEDAGAAPGEPGEPDEIARAEDAAAASRLMEAFLGALDRPPPQRPWADEGLPGVPQAEADAARAVFEQAAPALGGFVAGLPAGPGAAAKALATDPAALDRCALELSRIAAALLPVGMLGPGGRRAVAAAADGLAGLAAYTLDVAEALRRCSRAATEASPEDLLNLLGRRSAYEGFHALGGRLARRGADLQLLAGAFLWFLMDRVLAALQARITGEQPGGAERERLLDEFWPALVAMDGLVADRADRQALVAAARRHLELSRGQAAGRRGPPPLPAGAARPGAPRPSVR